MTAAFEAILAEGYTIPFGSLTEEQDMCKTYTSRCIEELLAVRQRERFLHVVKTCICGYPPADEDEPVVPENFSQYQFYETWDQLVDFRDKFDYLINCVAAGTARVAPGFSERYMTALLNVLTSRIATNSISASILSSELMQPPLPQYGTDPDVYPKERLEADFANFVAKNSQYTADCKRELEMLLCEDANLGSVSSVEADDAPPRTVGTPYLSFVVKVRESAIRSEQ